MGAVYLFLCTYEKYRISTEGWFMNELIKRITDDMKSSHIKIDEKHYKDIISYSDSYMEEDAFPKLAVTAMNYLVEIEKRDSLIKDLKEKLQYYEKEYSILAHKQKVPYAEDMKQRKENGFYPADKHISCETVKKLEELGMSKKEIAKQLGISRSTVYRKLKDAEEKGYTGITEENKRFKI